MANSDSRPPDGPPQPPGVEGEGMDPYPTYRDGMTTPHRTTSTKPTDVGLPRSRRTYALPIFIGLVVFALVIVIRLIWGGVELAEQTGEIPAPVDNTAEADGRSADGPLDTEVEPGAETGPSEVEATPGPADVPGGDLTTPVDPTPSQ